MVMSPEAESTDMTGASSTEDSKAPEWLNRDDGTAFIGPMEDVSALFHEFSSQEIIKLKSLESQNAVSVRRVSRDGCCFYRGYMFGLFEYFLNHKAEINPFIQKIEGVLVESIKAAGYKMETTEEFIKEVISCLHDISHPDSNSQLLEAIFNDRIKSNYIVFFARLMTATHMKLNAPLFEPFLTSHSSVEEYCKREVDPMWVEAEQLQITALTAILDIPVEIICIDQSPGRLPLRHVFPESPNSKVHLLFRPGHYDIIYC